MHPPVTARRPGPAREDQIVCGIRAAPGPQLPVMPRPATDRDTTPGAHLHVPPVDESMNISKRPTSQTTTHQLRITRFLSGLVLGAAFPGRVGKAPATRLDAPPFGRAVSVRPLHALGATPLTDAEYAEALRAAMDASFKARFEDNRPDEADAIGVAAGRAKAEEIARRRVLGR